MRKRLLHLLTLCALLVLPFKVFAQSDLPRVLALGNYDAPDQSEAYDGSNLQNSPVLFTYTYSGSQTLYLPEQLTEMKGKQITSLSFKYFVTDCYEYGYTSTLKLYLHEIDNQEFSKNADGKYLWENFDSEKAIATTEFTADFGDQSYGDDQEITFDLSQNPYSYQGKTLVVTIANEGSASVESGIQFYWVPSSASDSWRSLVFASDSKDFIANQTKDKVLNGNEDKWKNAPAVKFSYIEGKTPDPEPEPQPQPSSGKLTLGHFNDQNTDAAWDGFNMQNAPVIYTYNHSGSQVLYTAEELAEMKGKQITSMSFKCFPQDFYGSAYSSTMKLYLHEMDANQFTYNEAGGYYEWSDFDKSKVLATTEFSADFMDACINGTDVEVKFDLSQNPYYYTGKSLVVTIVNDTPQCVDSSDGPVRFYWIDSKKEDSWRSLVFASDSKDFFTNQEKDNAVKTTDNEDKWKNAPAVEFTYEEGEAPVPPTPDPNPNPEPTPGDSTEVLTLGHFDDQNTDAAWDGFNLQNAPVIYTYNHSGSQVLYTPEDLAGMKNKLITSMSFKCFPQDYYGSAYSSTMKLYLHEIDANGFTYNEAGKYYEWADFDKSKVLATTEFSADFMDACVNGVDVEVKFDLSQNPYYYTGKTLVVTIVNDTPQCVDSGEGPIRFYWIDSKKEDSWRSLVYAGDTDDFFTNLEKDKAVKTTDNEDQWKNAPAVQFTYKQAEAPVPPTPDPEPQPQPDPDATTELLTLGHFDDQNTDAAWDGFNLQNAPVIYTYNHSGSQVLYTPEELKDMKGQHISSMTFKCFAQDFYGSEPYESNMKLYLQEIDTVGYHYNESGEYYEWVNFDKSKVLATTEFSADFMDASINGTDLEVKFDLSKNPYYYTGKTLVVTVVNDAPQCVDSSEGPIRFYWIDSKKEEPWRSLVYGSDTEDFFANQEKDNAVKTTDNEDKWKNAPAVQFTYLKSGENPEPPTPSYFSGGEGTAENPYLISKAADMDSLSLWIDKKMTKEVYFSLTQDLTADTLTHVIGATEAFEGVFEGNKHALVLNINQPESDRVALFGKLANATLKNLQVKGQVTGKNTVAGIVAEVDGNSIIENVVNFADVAGDSIVGGIVGNVYAENDTVSSNLMHCANYGNVSGLTVVGGIVGISTSQKGHQINYIVNYGMVSGNEAAGMLVGRVSLLDEVAYGLNLGTTANVAVAGCVGENLSMHVNNVYFDVQALTHRSDALLNGKATSALVGDAFQSVEGWNDAHWLFAANLYPRLKVNGVENAPLSVLYATPILLAEENTYSKVNSDFIVVTENGVQWTAKKGFVAIEGNQAKIVDYGTETLVASYEGLTREIELKIIKPDFAGGKGTSENPYLISSVEDLDQLNSWINDGLTANKYFILTKDLTDAPYTEIVGSDNNFQGHFDGDKHTVWVDINKPDMSYVGLFGCVEGGSVKNLHVQGKVVGQMIVGGVAGQIANGAVLENVINSAEVSAYSYAGGIVGQIVTQGKNPASVVSHCANYGAVSVSYSCVGGVIGDMGQQVGNQIQHIANFAHVKGKKYSGGLIGNARPYDMVYRGLNVGTIESEKTDPCIGNTISSTIGELYYDTQYLNNIESDFGIGISTKNLVGEALSLTEDGIGFDPKDWMFVDSLFPRPYMNGLENNPVCVLYATPVMLDDSNTLNNVDKPFTVYTENGVAWSAKNGKVKFDGNHVELVESGDEVLVATYEGVTRELNIKVTVVPTGIEETAENAVNRVYAQSGVIVLDLNAEAAVQVTDLSGKTIQTEVLTAGTHRMAVQPGVYVVCVAHQTYKVCVNR